MLFIRTDGLSSLRSGMFNNRDTLIFGLRKLRQHSLLHNFVFSFYMRVLSHVHDILGVLYLTNLYLAKVQIALRLD